MGLEELKTILHAVQSLGNVGQSMFLWWIFLRITCYLIVAATVFGCVVVTAKLTSYIIRANRALAEIREILYPGGSRTWVSPYEVQGIKKALEDFKKME